MNAPFLHHEDIRAEAKRYFDDESRGREHFLIALYGRGDELPVPTASLGEVPVFSVGSELELRKRLLALSEPDAKAVFLLPFRHDLPMDLAGRFALKGRVRSIGRDARLKRLFDVHSVTGEALTSPLADFLLSHAGDTNLKLGGLELNEALLWGTWLQRAWGLDTSGGLALDSLLAFAALNGRGAACDRVLSAAPDVRTALDGFLTQSLGPAGPVVFQAWLSGQGERALQYAVLFEALRAADSVGLWVRSHVRSVFGVEDEDARERVARQLGEAVSTALPLYASGKSGDHKAPLRPLFERADALVDDAAVRQALVGSSRLPSGWRLRLDTLGQALADAALKPSHEALQRVLDAKGQLEAHANYLDDAHDRTTQRAEMAVRLLAWLTSDRSTLERGSAEPAHADVERLGRWYAEQGGFVDWARRIARGASSSLFDKGVHAVLEQADAIREALDLRFAGALQPWLSAHRPSHQVLPIDQVTKRVVEPFLQGNPERKLLVLLLDGMAWAQAVEILSSLGDRGDGWGPAAFHAQGRKYKLGDARTPVVLAGLPTVTDVSRTAFFAGKVMPPGKVQRTEEDPLRFRDNIDLKPFFAGAEYPRLFLKGEGHAAHGVASQEALTAIGQRDQRVVGVVINAIDSSLKGDTQQWHPWRAENVRSLPELLAAAKEHGRTVLLASDHGHVPADRFTEKAGSFAGGGARWRPLERETDPVESFEVKLSGPDVWRPKGAEAVALLADDKRRYGGGAHAGEHGGATLAEVVAPCLLIHWDDPESASVDPERNAQALFTPQWWHFDVAEPAQPKAPAPAETPRPKRGRSAPPENQLALGNLIAPPDAPPAPPAPQAPAAHKSAPPPSAAAKALTALPTLKDLPTADLAQLLAAVDYLLAREGIAQLSAFAAHLGLPPFRVQGFIARKLQKLLNLDGFQVITYDAAQVRLDREVLAQQFGVKL